jgi:hypothetical protein
MRESATVCGPPPCDGQDRLLAGKKIAASLPGPAWSYVLYLLLSWPVALGATQAKHAFTTTAATDQE